MTVKWKRQLSARLPWAATLLAVLFLALWLVGSIGLLLHPESGAPENRVGDRPWLAGLGMLAIWFVLVALCYMVSRRMMQVSIEDDMLVISGLLRTVRVPFADVKDVRASWAQSSTVTVELARPTPFGRTITFIAGESASFDEMPEAGETISRLVWEARRLAHGPDGPAREPREMPNDPLPPGLRPF